LAGHHIAVANLFRRAVGDQRYFLACVEKAERELQAGLACTNDGNAFHEW
jgi:hypothetical protein